jgi:hypothetical protein
VPCTSQSCESNKRVYTGQSTPVKVTKHHEWLQAKNCWFVPVVAATSGTLHPETLRLLYDFARLKTDAAEQHAVANSPTPRRNVRSSPGGGPAVQPPGLSYTAHWEVLGCALCLLTTTAISRTGPVWDRGFCPGSRRPRARVPLVVWVWDCFVMRLSCCFFTVFRSAICDSFVNKRMLLLLRGSRSFFHFCFLLALALE